MTGERFIMFPASAPPMGGCGAEARLRTTDYLGLGLFAFLLFGYAMVGGRPLTMHEAVVPQSAREMLADGDWIVPKSGGRPWLERPPLPQWITAAVAWAAGGADREWVVRLPPALMGAGTVLLVAWMAAGWFGRMVGLLSGFVLATMFEFTSYAWLAEQDIFLCALVALALALFVHLEFFRPAAGAGADAGFLGGRPCTVAAFYAVLGLTNVVKGMAFGPAMVLIPVAGFLAWNADRRQIGRYLWLWGWLLCVGIAVAWPLAAWARYPDVLDVWRFDLVDRPTGRYTAINKPAWYYLTTLPWETAPWALLAPLGLWLSARRAFREQHSPEQFLWCWAILPVVVLSLVGNKHHHYILPVLAPWAVLAALGLVWVRDRTLDRRAWVRYCSAAAAFLGLSGTALLWIFRASLPLPQALVLPLLVAWMAWAGVLAWALWEANGRVAMGAVLAAIVAVYWGIFSYALPITDQVWEDTAFLRDVRGRVPPDIPLFVNADLDSIDVFRILFYLDARARTLHNLSYLQDDRIRVPEVYVITRARDESTLAKLGSTGLLLQSQRSRRETSPGDRLTLFRLRFRDMLPRGPAPPRLSPMQVIGRQQGPHLVIQPGRN